MADRPVAPVHRLGSVPLAGGGQGLGAGEARAVGEGPVEVGAPSSTAARVGLPSADVSWARAARQSVTSWVL